MFHPAGATLPRPSPLPPRLGLSAGLSGGRGRWRLGWPASAPLSRWWPLARWLLLGLIVVAALAAAIFFLAQSGMGQAGGLHNEATLNQRPGQDLSGKEPPTGDWSTADEMPAAHDEDDALTLPGLPPGRPAEDEAASGDASTSTSSTSAASSTSATSATTRTSTSTTTPAPPSAADSAEAGVSPGNQTRGDASGSKNDEEEEMVYDTDELVIEGDDGDAEYEGDTEQTLPEFLESILSLWSSTPAPRVLNGHRYGDTQAGDQWPVASSSSPSPSTRAPSPAVSPTLPPRLSLVHRVTPTPTPEAPADDECESPRLPLCRGLLPYDLTLARPSVPQVPALRSPADLHAALPYFELVAQSGCSARVRAFLCPLLEPECVPRAVQPRRPCRRLCRAVAEDCQDFILNNLDLSRVFDCSYYPDSPHGDECLDLSAGGGSCLPREFGCGDGTCIPQRWLCDGRADCVGGADERNCTSVCPDDHFRCKSGSGAGPVGVTCVRASLRCDGRQDCPDGSDEVGCAANTGAADAAPAVNATLERV